MLEEFNFFTNDRGLSPEHVEDEFILGRNFMASYGNNRVYRIDGIEKKMTPATAFPNPEKGATYADYFKKQYGVKINDMKQFLVYSIKIDKKEVNGKIVETEQKIHLVPELMKPTGLTDELRKDKNAMQEVAKYTKLFPDTRVKRQENLIKQINDLKPDKNEMSLKIDANSNRIKGKVLNYPQIQLQKPMIPDKGNFIIKTPIFEANAKLQDWLIICPKKDE